MWRICIGIVSSLPGSGLRQTIEGAESCRVRSRFVPSLDGAVWPRSLLILRSLPLQMLNMPADDSSSGNAWNEEVWAMTLQNAGVHMIIKTMAAKTSEMEVLRRRPEDPKGIWYRLWMCISCSRRRIVSVVSTSPGQGRGLSGFGTDGASAGDKVAETSLPWTFS